MEEIEDQLDSDNEDQAAFLITSNSGTGDGQHQTSSNNIATASSDKNNNEFEQFGNI